MKKLAALLFSLALVARAWGYGEEGHQAVGAIADGRIKGTDIAPKLKNLLDGLSLQEAAIIPDKIKTYWDHGKTYHVEGHPEIESDLREFFYANLKEAPTGERMHHAFHYTDISIDSAHPTYRNGAIGTYAYDVVHMIPYCINVMTGELPEDNERRISKPVAIILLAHYVGDIHQPLHVGAAYFDEHNQIVKPKKHANYREDKGGNEIVVHYELNGHERNLGGNLHHFWDTEAVLKAFDIKAKAFEPALVSQMILNEPPDWKPTKPDPLDWAREWANEILPLAKQAHKDLKFEDAEDAENIQARLDDGEAYQIWAAQVVKGEIHKAGWRLAYLLDQIVK